MKNFCAKIDGQINAVEIIFFWENTVFSKSFCSMLLAFQLKSASCSSR